jgi:hypothetical protein
LGEAENTDYATKISSKSCKVAITERNFMFDVVLDITEAIIAFASISFNIQEGNVA